jgi:DNA modification methylase
MAFFRLIEGDAIDALRDFPAESVHCVVTSPPYWGLRDYGTGTWVGGDPACQHAVGNQVADNKAPGAITTGQRPGVDASHCRKCGALRKDKQIGLESEPEDYIASMVRVFREVKRVLRDDGTLWLNIGDSYSGSGKGPAGNLGRKHDERNLWKAAGGVVSANVPKGTKPKDLVGIPWMLAFALRADGWYLRSDIIWCKPNPMPESVRDRPTRSHEYIFLLAKSPNYHYDHTAIMEPAVATHTMGNKKHRYVDGYEGGTETFRTKGGLMAYAEKTRKNPPTVRNRRSVWTVQTKPYEEAHFATFPPELIKPCVLAGCPEGGVVLDPFAGSGTTGEVALENGRGALLIELNPDYCKLIEKRTAHLL